MVQLVKNEDGTITVMDNGKPSSFYNMINVTPYQMAEYRQQTKNHQLALCERTLEQARKEIEDAEAKVVECCRRVDELFHRHVSFFEPMPQGRLR